MLIIGVQLLAYAGLGLVLGVRSVMTEAVPVPAGMSPVAFKAGALIGVIVRNGIIAGLGSGVLGWGEHLFRGVDDEEGSRPARVGSEVTGGADTDPVQAFSLWLIFDKEPPDAVERWACGAFAGRL